MKKDFSAYLDLVRIGAAVVVFLSHLAWRSISGGFLWQAEQYGHSAVIIFFVLSGFVIQFSTEQKERTMRDYLVARFARLYSVVLPALLLTVVCDFIGARHNPAVYFAANEAAPLTKLAWGSVFLSQSWQKVTLLSNAPFWSLNYEFWYYLLFAAATFLRGPSRAAGILLCSLIAGPAILLLLPVWIMGAMAYRASQKLKLTVWSAGLIWLLSAIGVFLAVAFNAQDGKSLSLFLPPAYSAINYVIGLFFALNLVAASQLHFGLERAHRPIALIAGMTFALYLFHLPLLNVAAAFVPASLPMSIRVTVEVVFTLTVIFGLSFVTEGQKARWKGFFRGLFGLMRSPGTLTLAVSK